MDFTNNEYNLTWGIIFPSEALPTSLFKLFNTIIKKGLWQCNIMLDNQIDLSARKLITVLKSWKTYSNE